VNSEFSFYADCNQQYVIYSDCNQAGCLGCNTAKIGQMQKCYDPEHMKSSEQYTSTTNVPVSASEY